MSLINTGIKPFKVTAYHNGKFVPVTHESLKGKWSVVVFYPADFTFVCPTELGDLADNYAEFKKLGDWALKYKMLAAYHTHQQGSMHALDTAFEVSKGNAANVDLGHFMAATNPGGTPLDFLNKFHDRIASFHLKDRTSVAHCALNLPWGTGETPIAQILQTVLKNKWTMPATIELEYNIPEGSDAVKEVAKCLEFCRKALA